MKSYVKNKIKLHNIILAKVYKGNMIIIVDKNYTDRKNFNVVIIVMCIYMCVLISASIKFNVFYFIIFKIIHFNNFVVIKLTFIKKKKRKGELNFSYCN